MFGRLLLVLCGLGVLLAPGPTAAAVRSGTAITASNGSVKVSDPVHADAVAGVDCTGTTDSTTGIQNALNSLNTNGQTLWIPSQCIIRLASPGAGNAAVSVPNNVHIICEDQSAGFAAVRKRCVGGTYVDAACASSTECLGGGTCAYDFGASTFAPTGGSTYTMLKDASAQSSDIFIENCSFWPYQADPYQRCVGGTNAGDPCRQECTGGAIPGARCDVDGDCVGGGTCLRVADCKTVSGTCTGAPGSPSGAGKINPLDLARTSNVRLVNVNVWDSFVGDQAIKTGTGATIRDVNVAREITDCTSPIPGTPSTSLCFSTVANQCCYGAGYNTFAANNKANTEPTTSLTYGVNVGADSQLIRVTARGSTNGILAGDRSRLDECTIWPMADFGPGTAGGGYSVGALAQVAKSQARFLKSGATGVALTGADSTAIENKIGDFVGSVASSAQDIGVSLAGANGHATGNNIKNVSGSGKGISISASNCDVKTNYIEGTGSSAYGIYVNGDQATVTGNQIISNPVNGLNTGVAVEAFTAIVDGNIFNNMLGQSFWLKGAGSGTRFCNNYSALSTARPTSSLKPVHVLHDSTASQVTICSNDFVGGWRGIWTGARTGGLTNTNIIANRLNALAGAAFALGGAGVNVQSNYVNQAGQVSPSLTCDASCSNRGSLCQQDSDCTSCNGSVAKCLPEPATGFIGSPSALQESAHPSWNGNLLYMAAAATKQCTGTTTYVGSVCTVSAGNGSCASSAVCSGGPPAVCQSGADLLKPCCPGASPTCAVRTSTPFVRAVDYGSSATYSDALFTNNQLFPQNGSDNIVGLDFLSSFSLGNITLSRFTIVGNTMDGQSSTGSAIAFPTTITATNVLIADNNLARWTTDVANWKASYGQLSFPANSVALGSDFTNGSGNFVDVTGLAIPIAASRTYQFVCNFIFSSSAASTGIAFAMTGPTSPTTFTYQTDIMSTDTSSTSGITTMVGSGDNITSTATGTVPSQNTKYTASIAGTLVNASNAGTLQARVKSETANNVTVVKGSNCTATVVNAGT